jgi:hypothetical protein
MTGAEDEGLIIASACQCLGQADLGDLPVASTTLAAHRWDEAMAVYGGGQVLAAMAFENDGPPPSRQAAIAWRALWGAIQQLLQAAMTDPQVRPRLVEGRDHTLNPEGGEGLCA